MLVTMFLSMWISNTAAMALMVPIVDSICEAMFEAGEDTAGGEGRARTPAQERLRNMMLLACAYSANIGGMATLIGTGGNGMLAGLWHTSLGRRLSFMQWFMFAGPLSLALFASCFGVFFCSCDYDLFHT